MLQAILLTPAIVIIIVVLVLIFLILFIISSLWKRVPQDKAMVVTGLSKRVISGGGGLVVPMFERVDYISLENIKIEVRTEGALTEQGVGIIADGVAVLKVKSSKESILAAMEQFNTGVQINTINAIKSIAKDVLEGKLREIVSKMTVEEIYKDREKFASQVQEVAALDLVQMGLEIKAFTIRDISDENGYLAALGKKRIAEVKRDADIAQAEAAKETKIKTAEANRLGEQARLDAEAQIAQATKEKEIKVQAYRQEQESAKAIADKAYDIQANISNKQVTSTDLEVQLLAKQKETEIQQQESLRRQRELEATVQKQADADKYKLERQADADKYKVQKSAEAQNYMQIQSAEAQSKAIRLEGEATADAIRMKALAEAEGMRKKAEAYKMYNDAAMTQMVIDRLPEIARAVADPLARTEKIVVIDGANAGGTGASKVTGYVTDIMSSLPEVVQTLTGFDINAALKKAGVKDEAKDLKNEEVTIEN